MTRTRSNVGVTRPVGPEIGLVTIDAAMRLSTPLELALVSCAGLAGR